MEVDVRYGKNNLRIPSGKRYIIEGGSGAGKENLTKALKAEMDTNQIRYAFLDCRRPLSEWFAEYRLPAPVAGGQEKRIAATIERFFNGDFWLILAFAEKLTDAKIPVISKLLARANTSILIVRNYGRLSGKLKADFMQAELISVSGRDVFDCTYILIGIILIILVVIGYHDIIFILAAVRYIFRGLGK